MINKKSITVFKILINKTSDIFLKKTLYIFKYKFIKKNFLLISISVTGKTFLITITTTFFNPLRANPTKWSSDLLAVADGLFQCVSNFVGLVLKGLPIAF